MSVRIEREQDDDDEHTTAYLLFKEEIGHYPRLICKMELCTIGTEIKDIYELKDALYLIEQMLKAKFGGVE